MGEPCRDALCAMSRPFTLDSIVKIPVEHDHNIVSVALAQEGAVELAYGIRLLVDGAENDPPLVPFPNSAPGRSYPIATGLTLRGLSINCFGRIFLAQEPTVKLRCDFSVEDKVIASSDLALVEMKTANLARTFQIHCRFI